MSKKKGKNVEYIAVIFSEYHDLISQTYSAIASGDINDSVDSANKATLFYNKNKKILDDGVFDRSELEELIELMDNKYYEITGEFRNDSK